MSSVLRQSPPTRSYLVGVIPAAPVDRLLGDLTPPQQLAVTSDAAPLCVIAGAGAGKTRVVTRRIAYRCETGSARADRTLALTFTRKAAAELTERLGALDSGRAGTAKVTAGTFHAVASAQLKAWWRDRRTHRRTLVDSKLALIGPLMGEDFAGTQLDATELTRIVEWAKARSISPQGLTPDNPELRNGPLADLDAEVLGRVASLYDRYELHKRRRGLMDFDDLIWHCAETLEVDHEFAAAQRWRWSHVYVDEYQDLNPLQFRLLRAWLGSNTDLCVVGDPNQSIYAWNGSDRSLLERFAQHWPAAQVLRLEVNHRCSPQIVGAAAAVLGSAGASLSASAPDGRPVRCFSYESDQAELDGIAGRLLEAKREGRAWQEMAVLARTNAQLDELARALDAAGIPTRVAGADGRPPYFAGRTRRYTTVNEPADTGFVTLSSFHRSKGLEWPLVMLIGLEEGLVPFGPPADDERIDEEKRLLYVAMTRAVDELQLSWSKLRCFAGRVAERRPCRWLATFAPAKEMRAAVWTAVETAQPAATPPADPAATATGTEPGAAGLRLGSHPSSARSAPPPQDRPCGDVSGVPSALIGALTAWRDSIARFNGVPPRLVLADEAIAEVATRRPETLDELAPISGIGPFKARRYGVELLEILGQLGKPSRSGQRPE